MKKEVSQHVLDVVYSFLGDKVTGRDTLELEPISPDGSTREFFRVKQGETTLCLAILPAGESQRDKDEQRSVYQLGRHLRQQEVNVPEIYGADLQSGLVLMEDLGDTRLYDHIFSASEGDDRKEVISTWYRKVVEALAHMQYAGGAGIDPSWCYDSYAYDQDIMVRTEAQYYERAFFNNYISCTSPEGLQEEFLEISKQASSGMNDCFLHRDFQSRNIMIQNEEPFFIDFQGGRMGPPGYDLASLLLDPYVGLDDKQKQEMYGAYMEAAAKFDGFDAAQFNEVYPYLAMQRNLQIIGAFSFLHKEKKKDFFKEYIHPSVVSLHTLLQQNRFEAFPNLRKTAEISLSRVSQQVKE